MALHEHDTALTPRQRQVLEATVDRYIATAEPVGSRTLVEWAGWDVSSATVRNAMAQLEEMGYLHQPHTSSGRVPSQMGYRVYVDGLLQSQPDAGAPTSDVRKRLLTRYRDLAPDQWESLFRSTCQLLSQLSQYIGVVIGGETGDRVLERLELVALGGRNLMTVLILKPGIVRQRIVTTETDLDAAAVRVVVAVLNDRLAGKTLREIRTFASEMATLSDWFRGEHRDTAIEVTRAAFLRDYDTDVYWDGVRNVIGGDELDGRRQNALYGALESRKSLATLFDAATDARLRGEDVRALIGTEIPSFGLEGCSFVAATYYLGDDTFGVVGVIGPMRMQYPKIIPLVGATADLITQQFDGLQ
ncbi:heat-inducible transcription repressor HrcA [Candidatus Poribacteria bacterium]|jgi:heat-inducible transcriptional repressor|nr:heat-inducible transcription repressor HrcA [Candidatus Poribacteria bacterium]MBT5532951.1 heat-inducible transcription repressor HrcA [Candidatus Poribacteria bacterium]MBT7807731.1 heat-inducible transcription repressor HrcA [Candidatus Poribacteria bacterium]